MSSLPEVEVLLATCNGERFLREQIDSIIGQDYANLRVLARDDGSTDGTAGILQEYANRLPGRFQVMPASAPTGTPKTNFLLLMQASTAQYVCLSDQDDVWLPDKVSKNMAAMNQLAARWGETTPLLVFTDLRLADQQLATIHDSFWKYMGIIPENIHRPARFMLHCVVTGSTTMMNRSLLELSLRMSAQTYMHDGWISWVASYLGKAGIVRSATVLYRQHDRNVVGTGAHQDPLASKRSLQARILEPRIAIDWDIAQRHALAFLRTYHDELPAGKRRLLAAFVRCQTSKSRVVRVATLIAHGFFFAGLKRNLALVIYLWRMKKSESTTG